MSSFQKQQDGIWNHYQNIDSEKFTQETLGRFRYLLKHIPKGQRICNIGVGAGQFEKLAAETHDVYCLDPNEESIDTIRRRLNFDSEKAKRGYSSDIPFEENFFDSVVMSEVLEHLDDGVISQTLAEICRVLKPYGFFIGTVPSDENLADNTVFCPECKQIFHKWGHCQSFDKERLQNLLSKYFEVQKLRDTPLINFKDRPLRGKLTGLFRLLLYKLKLFKTDGSLFFLAANCQGKA